MSSIPSLTSEAKTTLDQNTTLKTDSNMEKINSTILKTAIEAIPLLTQDNYTLWRNRVENMLDLQGLRTALTMENGTLTASEDIQLRTIITSKLDSTIHPNVINHDNKNKLVKYGSRSLTTLPPPSLPTVRVSSMSSWISSSMSTTFKVSSPPLRPSTPDYSRSALTFPRTLLPIYFSKSFLWLSPAVGRYVIQNSAFFCC
ncbi:hypothetical protein PTTG_03871, partial [Puccinia triticina 1-1 BBBD Race 1]